MGRHLHADATSHGESPKVSTLLGDIIGDVQTLVRQEMTLARVELRQEWSKTKTAVAMYSVAAAVSLVAILLLGIAVAQGLVALGLPGWGAYGLTALAFAGLGAWLMKNASKERKSIDLVPKETVESLKENMQWIRNQT